MMRSVVAAIAACAMVLASPAFAALTKADLDAVGLHPPENAKVPLALWLTESDGRRVTLQTITASKPTLLVLVDFTCHTICGPILSIVATDILRARLVPARDFNFVVIGIDPRQTPKQAEAMKLAELADTPELRAAAHFVSTDAASFARLATAIGYRAHYDAEARVFAHPADLLVLAPGGEVSRVLPGLALDPGELRLALVEAGSGRIASLAEHFRILCYGLDPALGIYTRPVENTLWAAAILTLIGLVGGIVLLERRRRAGAR
jgi:protein SCO1